jgi:hypothetical protein
MQYEFAFAVKMQMDILKIVFSIEWVNNCQICGREYRGNSTDVTLRPQ